jgi:hypothetical protein
MWGGSPAYRTEVMKAHVNLKYLKTGISLRNVDSLKRTVGKFPNLEELCIGVEGSCLTNLKLTRIFATLQQLKSLRAFKWRICGPVDVAGVLSCFADAAGRMRKLKSCHLRFICSTWNRSFPPESKEFLKNQNQLLERLLTTKRSSCTFLVTTNSKELFKTGSNVPSFDRLPLPPTYRLDWKLILLTFIRMNGLPIEFRYSSTQEQEGL